MKQGYLSKKFRTLVAEPLESRHVLDAVGLLISELSAANDTLLLDSDGDASDWLEIHNPTDLPVSLSGWHLTDDADDLTKWTFPDVTLLPAEHQIVFASDKNRTAGELHTNFKLSRDGEYLALVQPDQTIEAEYRPHFPEQTSDVSYGLAVNQFPLLQAENTKAFHVPSSADAALDNQWTRLDFDDSAWKRATGAIGFDVRPTLVNAGFGQKDFSSWEVNGSTFIVDADYGVAPAEGLSHALISTSNSNSTRLAIERFLDLERFALDNTGNGSVTRASAISREVTVSAGGSVSFDWNFLTNDSTNLDFAFVTIQGVEGVQVLANPNSSLKPSRSLEFASETGYQSFQHVFGTAGTYKLGIGVAQQDTAMNDSAVLIDNLHVDGTRDAVTSSLISQDVTDLMHQVNSSIWIREEFSVNTPDQIRDLQLSYRSEDGFVVYVNGQRVFSRHAPEDLLWNSAATGSAASARTWQRVMLANVLQSGLNVVAVQGLNQAGDDPSFLFDLELVGIGEYATEPGFLPIATPGQLNLTDAFQYTQPVEFSHRNGFYDGSFQLQLDSSTPDSQIRFTTDGSVPSLTNGQDYSTAITIERTTVVRAAAFRSGYVTIQPNTRSYLFANDVLDQSNASVLDAGFPATWGNPDSWGNFFAADYGMDPAIINGNEQRLLDSLSSVPTLSIVMDQEDMFGARGIYSNPQGRGDLWERPMSLEVIYPDGSEGAQIDGGIRIQGGISRQADVVRSTKKSLRLVFREEYGESKFEFPFFGPNAATTFDSISLRSSTGENIALTGAGFLGVHYIRDEFARRLALSTDNVASHGNFMHLYINGLYWGLYNPAERIDAQFAANYLGGDKDEWDVLNAGDLGREAVTPINGTIDAWNDLLALAEQVNNATSQNEKTAAYMRLQGKNSDGSNNPDWESYLDTQNYIDYLITNVYLENYDWPGRNYYMARRQGPASEGFQFFMWDAEFTLDGGSNRTLDEVPAEGPVTLLPWLKTSDAFRVEFADRVYQLFRPGGPLYVNSDQRIWDPDAPENNVPASLYDSLVESARSPLFAESARWGDSWGGPTFTVDETWQNKVNNNFRAFFPTRSLQVLSQFEDEGYYLAPPEFSVNSGPISDGTELILTSGSGSIYYTLDGSDPRLPDGSLAPGAILFDEQAIVLTNGMTVTARSLQSNRWSAVRSETYLIGAEFANVDDLRLTEINYHPHDALVQFGEPDIDADEFEFIEIQNVSETQIELAGVQLVTTSGGQGVEFTFGNQQLAPGQHVVIPKNRDAFFARYGQDDITLAVGAAVDATAWTFQGSLSNSGEAITLQTADKRQIQQVTYRDGGAWPGRADGDASSLEIISVEFDYADPKSWQSSSEFGGSPGRSGAGPDNQIVINEVLTNSTLPAVDQIELANRSNRVIDVSGWYLSDSSNNYFKYQFPLGVHLPGNGYHTVDETEFQFGLNSTEDDLYLIQADANGRPIRFVDRVSFGATQAGVTLGRWPNRDGSLYPMASPTMGFRNSGPKISDVVITEIHASPAPLENGIQATEADVKFVELLNHGQQSVDLSEWKIQGEIEFEFAANTVLQAGETLTIVPFDPQTDTLAASTFRLLYAIPTSVRLAGPFSGTLIDDAGKLELVQPRNEAPEDSAYVVMDAVEYSNVASWPNDVIDSFQSLNRTNPSAFGGFAASFVSRRANPGSFVESNVSGDVNQDQVTDVMDIDLLCAAVQTQMAPNHYDLDGDGQISSADIEVLLYDIMQIVPGDVNLDGVFNSTDLTAIFTRGEYDDLIPLNSTWSSGDWNCDGEFDSSDLVVVFQLGDYETGDAAVRSTASIHSVDVAATMSAIATAKARKLRNNAASDRLDSA
ncbi:MAG: lamin tail domain-containing protein [Planctomycetales bacterium]|nr:lamin tail domain-containing protein [Planctomycetales bacterium]